MDGLANPRPITPAGDLRFGDLQLDVRHNRVVAVREDHRIHGQEPINTLVILDLDGPNDDGGTVIVSGTDFVSSPRLDQSGARIAWLSWNHPNMPWDGTVLSQATLSADGALDDIRFVAGGPRESVILPGWDSHGRLVFVSDCTGWWHLYREDGSSIATQLTSGELEFGVPLWQFGASTWTALADGSIVTAWTKDGRWHLGVLNPESRELTPIALPFTSLSDIRSHPDGERVVVKAGSPTESASLIIVDPMTGVWELLSPVAVNRLDPGYLSVAQALSWTTTDGTLAHGFYYAPVNQNVQGPAGALPPLIVESHGGPTGSTSDTYDLKVQFWTSRGFAILDVNYGGSTGYGRGYRERLNGSWGVVDVDDCITGALSLAEGGLVDRDRMIIRGGSAGGFTTLAALAFRDVFAAGVSYYGIGDLEAMVLDTHKFESRYLDSLVGPYPEAIDVYRGRSAIHHVDKLSSAMILFQGLDDKVVPPGQSVMMAEAVRAKGLPVALLTFEGEGHGFRMASTIRRALEAELSFYGQVFGFEPADDIPRLRIDNLTTH
jgi:dipeptidyl aminopeptidase/acylaminoacyl peptidase